MRRSAPASAAEGSAGVSVSTPAVNSSRGGVWWSASSSTMEGPADFSPSTGILGVRGFVAFELRLRLRRFITKQFYRKGFRTAPLWGVGQRVFFLHDGRTTNLVDAIRDHKSRASEANKVTEHFNRLTTQEQQEVIDFLRSL